MAVELVGGALLSAFLQVTFKKLASARIQDYFRARNLNDKLLKKLNITLLSINAVVNDAELKQIRNQPVKAWLDAVKDAVLDAEDLLEEIDIEVSRCKLEAESESSTSKVWKFFNASSSSFDKQIEPKMHEVLDNLEYLSSKKDILGLKEASRTYSGFGVGSGYLVSQKVPSTSLPVDSVIFGRDVAMKKLEISNCKQLVTSISLAPSIHRLHLDMCGELQFNYLPSTLRFLEICGGGSEGSLVEWVGNNLQNMSLESLVIKDFPTMNIPLECGYSSIWSLDITSCCDSLRNFPLDLFPKLKSLKLQNCSNLEMISQDREHDHRLKLLSIAECPKFVSFPKGRFSAPDLDYFKIYELENLKSLPECMHTLFPSLTVLIIKKCPQIESFSDGHFSSSLKRLHLDTCSESLMASLESALRINTSLEVLDIRNVDMESFPDQGLLPLSLTSLRISDSILLEQRCKEPNGEDWVKISHIQRLIPLGERIGIISVKIMLQTGLSDSGSLNQKYTSIPSHN
ncbi:hypothetical protein P8452_69483 [Trifolium repens]|nr:hypothetical protein P8452_69483 [Trifolium repens]